MPAEMDPLDLRTPARVHIVGVGGAGMSALALLLAQMGHVVSGSDLRPSSVLERLSRAGVTISVGHHAGAVEGADWVTASPAVPTSNPELRAAEEHSIPFFPRATVMGALSRTRRTIAVAGTHGKTTTSSMLSLIALESGTAPSFLIGAELTGLGVNAHWGEGDLLIIEADESYGSFAELTPQLVGITNVEADHLDHYGTLDELERAFRALVQRSSGGAVVFSDDAGAKRVGSEVGARSVGTSPSAQRHISAIELGRSSSSFVLELSTGAQRLRVGAPGFHNVANAGLAAALADDIGIDASAIVAGLARFAGVPRRFEFRGEAAGITFVDDYAHLPAEVAATLAAAASGGFSRVIAVFQPHRYTRTQAVAAGFGDVFGLADEVLITDVYASGETPIPGVSGRLVVDAVVAAQGSEHVHYVPNLDDLPVVLDDVLRSGDICLTMGAGDLTDLPDVLLERRR